jgi:hypothetical protein
MQRSAIAVGRPGLLAAVLCVVLPGCYPVLGHPTRVESGAIMRVILSTTFISDSTYEGVSVPFPGVPSLDVELSTGIRDTSFDSRGPGLRLGASAGLSGFGLSAYAELPRHWLNEADAGVGIAFHGGALASWMPYAQFGRRMNERHDWFVRNALAFGHDESARHSMLWIPTLGVTRVTRTGSEYALFLSLVFGNQPWIERPCFLCDPAYAKSRVMIGLSSGTRLRFPDFRGRVP